MKRSFERGVPNVKSEIPIPKFLERFAMNQKYACGSAEHVSRRTFLHGAAGALGMLSFGGMVHVQAA